MSLVDIIREDEKVKEFMKNIIPPKEGIRTLTGKVAFSNKEYVEKAPYFLEDELKSMVVGTAFDYLARWIIARTAECNRNEVLKGTVAENGLQEFKRSDAKKYSVLSKKYKLGLEYCEKYIVGKTVDVYELCRIAIYFAKLEQVIRANHVNTDIEYYMMAEDEILKDLLNLYQVFKETFILSGLVKTESVVVYNPRFGIASYMCRGADADIYIDGTLYDFKCTKKIGYSWNEIAQLLGYYFLDLIAKRKNDSNASLFKVKIERLALYKARHGEIEYFDADESKYGKNSYEFENHLNRIAENGVSPKGEKVFYKIIELFGLEAEPIKEEYERYSNKRQKEEIIELLYQRYRGKICLNKNILDFILASKKKIRSISKKCDVTEETVMRWKKGD